MELIVAVDREWGIGYRGELLAHLSEDLRHFKDLTLGKTVIFGSNTLATFPGGRPLKGRNNLILHPDAEYTVEGATVLHSLEELFTYVGNHPEQTYVVIGGASVYRQLLPYCSKAHVTKFDRSFPKDVWFENLDERDDWRLREESPLAVGTVRETGEELTYRFCTYERVKQN